MVKDILKNILVFLITFVICVGALLLVCQIPQSAIDENSRQSSEYFSDHNGFPVVLNGFANTRVDNYADCVLFNVIYNVDSDQTAYSVIAAPYYRIEGNDAREDYASAVIAGKEPNNEYSRYWHGSQVFIRPLLTVTSVEGVRLALFGLLAILNIVLAVLLIRRKLYAPTSIYFASMLLVNFWMTAFTIEYIMSFLVMSAACIAVFLLWHKGCLQISEHPADRRPSIISQRDKRLTYVFLISGMTTCFLDFLTSETMSFTVPFILFVILSRYQNAGSQVQAPDSSLIETAATPFATQFRRLVKWGFAWLMSYALMFAIKWALVYLSVGKSAFFNALENAAYRIEGAVALEGISEEALASGQQLFLGILRNLACLIPLPADLSAGTVMGIIIGLLAILGAILYLFRGERVDGTLLGILGIVALIPYLRYLCLSNHAYIHYFFTYRAQMATIMAVIAIMAYTLKPSYILHEQRGSRKGSKSSMQNGGKKGAVSRSKQRNHKKHKKHK